MNKKSVVVIAGLVGWNLVNNYRMSKKAEETLAYIDAQKSALDEWFVYSRKLEAWIPSEIVNQLKEEMQDPEKARARGYVRAPARITGIMPVEGITYDE